MRVVQEGGSANRTSAWHRTASVLVGRCTEGRGQAIIIAWTVAGVIAAAATAAAAVAASVTASIIAVGVVAAVVAGAAAAVDRRSGSSCGSYNSCSSCIADVSIHRDRRCVLQPEEYFTKTKINQIFKNIFSSF